MTVQSNKLRETLQAYGDLPLDKQFEMFRKNRAHFQTVSEQVDKLIREHSKEGLKSLTDLCKNHTERPCKYGTNCRFSHSYAVQRAAMRIFKNPNYKQTVCKKGKKCPFEEAKRCNFIHKNDPEYPSSQKARGKKRDLPSIVPSKSLPAGKEHLLDSPEEKQRTSPFKGNHDTPISCATQPSHVHASDQSTTPHSVQLPELQEIPPLELTASALSEYHSSVDYLRDLDGNPSFLRTQLRAANADPAELARKVNKIERALVFGKEPLPSLTWKTRLCDAVIKDTECGKGRDCEDAHSLAFFYASGKQLIGPSFKTEECPSLGTSCEVQSCTYTHESESFLFSDAFLNGGDTERVATINERPEKSERLFENLDLLTLS